MYSGSHANRGTPSRKRPARKRLSLLPVALVVLAGVLVGSTIAYLVSHTDPIENRFTTAEVATTIEEDFTDKIIKETVKVKNTGNVNAFIRAAVVVTWQNASGNVYPTAPVLGEYADYIATYPGNGWVKHGDYYYYTSPVKPNESTGVLLTRCMMNYPSKAPEGYTLHVEILASAIQSEPIEAVNDAWGVTIANGNVISAEGGNAA